MNTAKQMKVLNVNLSLQKTKTKNGGDKIANKATKEYMKH